MEPAFEIIESLVKTTHNLTNKYSTALVLIIALTLLILYIRFVFSPGSGGFFLFFIAFNCFIVVTTIVCDALPKHGLQIDLLNSFLAMPIERQVFEISRAVFIGCTYMNITWYVLFERDGALFLGLLKLGVLCLFVNSPRSLIITTVKIFVLLSAVIYTYTKNIKLPY